MPLDAWLQMLSTFSGKQPPRSNRRMRRDSGIRIAKGTLNRLPPNGPLPTRPRGARPVSLRGVFENALRRVFFVRQGLSWSGSC